MPRTRRTAAAQKKTSLEDPLVLEGDPDGVAPAGKITREEKEHLRGLQMSFVKRMYEHAKAFLQQGMERWETEGVGDCWLLTIMAGWEVKDPALVNAVPDDGQSRQNICTSRRVAIVKFAADAKKNGAFRLLCEMCGEKVDFKDPNDVKRAQRDISKRLADWKKEKHYGMDQNLMHACAGWFLRRNLLNIDIPERLLPGYSALNATPCPPAATHDLLCVCAVGMHVTALLNHAGVGIDHGSVNLLDHDLEEIIRSGNPPRTSKGLVGRGEDALVSEEKLAERLAAQQALLEKNLQYIVANREKKVGGWTIMFNVRSSPFSPRALALHSLAATLVRRLRATTSSPWCPFTSSPSAKASSSRECRIFSRTTRRSRLPSTRRRRRRAVRPITRERCPPRRRKRRLGSPNPSQRRRRRR